MRFISAISAMIVAGVLLYSGLVHAWQPYFFMYSIAAYKIVSAQLAGVVGIFIPYLQIVLALCIAFRKAEKVALWMAGGLFATYALAQASVLARGLEIDCGCFGFVASQVNGFSIMIPLALLMACVLAVQRHRFDGEPSHKDLFHKGLSATS
ncbi:MAG: MauE/DoxX family redox-associated membrane protein [Bythopirellula sp.]|nr:MauE/DoxX family redox-associated membrane protein [Bythopirellula sp.]